ncbi:MAG: MexH family multidrug efflux RND transporter periplasmic adaptor subunit [Bacteroidia bacterium]|nr:MAG: MexH family multidrug efflux RND transporter periplasmic adaptor subunit [Bacteroidia bacterium]
MKTRYVAVAASLVLLSCSSHSKPESLSLQEKKRRLEKLRQEVLTLQSQIAELEAAIQAEDSTFGQAKRVAVGYTILQPRPFTSYLELQGSVDNRQAVTLTAKIPAPVTRLYVQEGQSVAAGQLLAEQDAEVIRKNLAEVMTRLELARTLYEKQKKLYEEGIGAEVQYLTAKNNKEALEATVATLQEQLRGAQIRAPFAGRVDAVFIRVGELLAPGAPAIRLIGSGQPEIRVDVPESYVRLVRPGLPVQVEIPDLDLRFSGRIAVVSQSVNPLNRTVTVIIRDLPASASAQLHPNLVAYVRLPEKNLAEALTVPLEAVQFQDTSAYVYVVKGGLAKRKAVQVIATQGGETAVRGLSAGDTVVTVGASTLADGQPILLRNL